MSDPLAILNFSWIENKTEVVELSQGQFIAYMAVGIPSWILYILIILLLIKPSNKKIFESSYFKLATVVGFSDILLYVVFNFQHRFLLFAPLSNLYVGIPDRSFFLRFIFFAAYFLRYFKGCLVLATSFNRCTSVLAYKIHEKIWKYTFGISLLCSLLIALSLTWFYFFGRILLVPMDVYEVTYALAPKGDLFPTESALKLALFGLISGSSDLIVNIITCVAIFRERHKNGSFNKIASGLMIITLIEFVTQILMFVAEGNLFVLAKMKIYDGIFNDFYFAMCWITDLNTLLKPYTLLLMSTAVRLSFLETYCGYIKSVKIFKTVSTKVQTM